jgi:hypothetical protein
MADHNASESTGGNKSCRAFSISLQLNNCKRTYRGVAVTGSSELGACSLLASSHFTSSIVGLEMVGECQSSTQGRLQGNQIRALSALNPYFETGYELVELLFL